MAEELSLKSKVLFIENEVIDLTAPSDLWGVNCFVEISKNGNKYLNDAFLLVKDDDLTIQQKQILLYALQKADIQFYKYFLKNISMLFRHEEIEEIIVYYAFGYGVDWSYSISENYRDRIIQEAIDLCLGKEVISNKLKEFLTRIKTGESWRNKRRILRS